MHLLLASGNRHKFVEFSGFFRQYDIFTQSGVELLLADDAFLKGKEISPDVEETGSTYEENALIKAAAWANEAGIPAIADDSGLEVAHLSWRPGIHSARAVNGSDEDRVLWLLQELDGVADRRACFVANLVVAFPSCNINTQNEKSKAMRDYFSIEGRCWGRISAGPRGSNGFGYDPVFIPDGFEGTFAELDPSEKSRISHRAIAMRGMVQVLPSVLKYHTVQHQ